MRALSHRKSSQKYKTRKNHEQQNTQLMCRKHLATLTLPTNPLTLASGEVALKLVGEVASQVDVVVVISVGPQER